MAKFEEFEPFPEKQVEKKVQDKTKIKNKSIKLSGEEKRKVIAYTVLGVITLGFVFYAVNDFSGEETKTVQELGIPESEADKYNSKLQAIEQGEKPTTTTPDLEDAYKTSSSDIEKEKNDEAARKLNEQLNALQNEEKEIKPRYRELAREKKTVNPKNTSNQLSQKAPNSIAIKTISSETIEETEESTPISTSTRSGFFRNSSSKTVISKALNSNILFYGSIHTDQNIKEGSRVKMRLTKTIAINNNTYPVNTIIYGIAKIQPNRLKIEINKINQTDVKLEIFDAEDSNSGIYVQTPNLNAMIRKEFKKDALDEQDLEKIPFSKTLKNLFAKKAKEENIELLNNYKIIIKEKNEN